jgi:hypothetical protein
LWSGESEEAKLLEMDYERKACIIMEKFNDHIFFCFANGVDELLRKIA